MNLKWAKGFEKDARGTVAVIFAIVSVVVLGAAGMALDFINASGIRTSLQHALDSAVLAAAAAHVATDNEAKTVIAEYMAINWAVKYPSLDALVSQSLSDGSVSGEASVVVPTLISGVLGIQTM